MLLKLHYVRTAIIILQLICFRVQPVTALSASDPRWHLQRIVQRQALSSAQLISRGAVFNLSSIPIKPVTIYVIDSGIRIDHEDFAPSRASYGKNILNSDQPPSDCNGHGTHVASLAGGLTSGVAVKAKLVAVRVLNCDGTGTCGAIVGALEWVLKDSKTRDGRSVAVLSVGSTSSACASSARASRLLWEAGVLTVAAAGNLASDSCKFYPARNEETMSIGATDVNDRRFKKSNIGACVDMFAPGVDVHGAWYEDNKKWKEVSGTSMAAPLVVGTAALILGADDSISAPDVREILTSSSTENAIYDSSGSLKMNKAENKLLFAPWKKLYDSIPINLEQTRALHIARIISARQGTLNNSATYMVVSISLTPKVQPAMAYSTWKIARAMATMAILPVDSIVRRRALGSERLQSGEEPTSVALVFYTPVAEVLLEEYRRRVIEGAENGTLQTRSGENITFTGGSVRDAIGRSATLPPAADVDTESANTTNGAGQSPIIIGAAVGGVIGVIVLLLGVVVVRKALNRPQRNGANDEAVA